MEISDRRERLESVTNMVVSGEYPVYYLVFRVQRNHQPKHVTFYNFPDKYWQWDDMRPSIFGLTVRMTNYENNTIYLFGSDSKEPCHSDEPDDDIPIRNWFAKIMLRLFSKTNYSVLQI